MITVNTVTMVTGFKVIPPLLTDVNETFRSCFFQNLERLNLESLFFFQSRVRRKSREEQMTFCVSDGSLLLGKRGANAARAATHTAEVGHFTTPDVGDVT